MISLTIDAFGIPETQGSARAFVRGGRAIVTSANPNLRPWRETVTWAARDAMGVVSWAQVTGPVFVEMTFWLPRPKSAPKTRDVWPVTGKDGDKLLRGVLDSLTNAGVWVDDSQVVDGHFTKRYAVGPHLAKIHDPGFHWAQPGVHIEVMVPA